MRDVFDNVNSVIRKGVPILILMFLILTLLPVTTLAHPPANMELDYDFLNQKLNVTITHIVANPNDHYIESVEIKKNDAQYLFIEYTSQPTTSTFTYTYDVEAVNGDDLEVTATCSITGSITEQLTVDAPATDEVLLIVNPDIDTIDENTEQRFNVSVYYNGEPLDDVTLKIEVKLGSASNYQEVSTGQYTFTYTAPDVNKELTETIDITASKEGLDDADERLEFTIKDVQVPSGECPPTLDGVIDEGEYEFKAAFGDGDFNFHWKVNDDTIIIGLEAKTKGWVAIGIEPSDRMKDADMIFGWVTDAGDTRILDCFSTGTFGPHPPDTELGGTSDILCYGGREVGDKTIIEFKRLLSTGDTYDQDIPSDGEIDIIWAFGENDDFESQHSRSERGYGTVDISTGEYSEEEPLPFWLFHAVLMTLGFVLMILGITLAKVMKKKKWWLKTHKLLGALGAILSVLGLLSGFYMVSISSGEHFRVPHAFLGVIAIVLIVLTPILGFAQFKVKKNRAKIRMAHRWFGRIAMVLMLLNIIAGISLVGVI